MSSKFGELADEAIALEAIRDGVRAFIEGVIHEHEKRQRQSPRRPDYAISVPGCKAGDRLYAGCLDESFGEYIAVYVHPAGHVQMISTKDWQERPVVYWAWDEVYTSLAEAVKAAAESDADYHAKGLRRAQQALELVASGADLTRYLGVPADE